MTFMPSTIHRTSPAYADHCSSYVLDAERTLVARKARSNGLNNRALGGSVTHDDPDVRGRKPTGGWKLANRAGGANVNQLMSSDPADVEALAGMSWLTGAPVEVERA